MFGIYPADAVWSLIILPVLVALTVAALIQVARAVALSSAARVGWIAAIILLPVVGSLAWFVFGVRTTRSAPDMRNQEGAASRAH